MASHPDACTDTTWDTIAFGQERSASHDHTTGTTDTLARYHGIVRANSYVAVLVGEAMICLKIKEINSTDDWRWAVWKGLARLGICGD